MEEAAASAHKQASDVKQRGNTAFTSKDYTRAIELYSQAISVIDALPIVTDQWIDKLDNLERTIHLNLAACYLGNKEYDSAIEECDKVIKDDDKNPKAWFRRSRAHHALGALDDAITDMTRVTQLLPNDKQYQSELVALVTEKTKSEEREKEKEREREREEQEKRKQEDQEDVDDDVDLSDLPPLDDFTDELKARGFAVDQQPENWAAGASRDTSTATSVGKGQSTTTTTTTKATGKDKGKGLKKGFLSGSGGFATIVKDNEEKKGGKASDPLVIPEVQESMKEDAGLMGKKDEWMTPELIKQFAEAGLVKDPARFNQAMELLGMMQKEPERAGRMLQADPKLAEIFTKFSSIMGDHFHKLGEQQEEEQKRKAEASRFEPAAPPSVHPGLTQEQTRQADQAAMNPEVQAILVDPEIQGILNKVKQNPDDPSVQMALRRPGVFAKIQVLMNHGLLGVERR